MGRMSRQKGKRGEREAAAELGALLGCGARRGVQYHGGPDSPDVVLDGGVKIHVEAKRTETLSVYVALSQAASDAGDSTPMVWHRRNGKGSVCIVATSNLVALAREICNTLEKNKLGNVTKVEKAKVLPRFVASGPRCEPT